MDECGVKERIFKKVEKVKGEENKNKNKNKNKNQNRWRKRRDERSRRTIDEEVGG